MTSANSLNSNRFSSLFKYTFKRNLAIYLVIQAVCALYAYFITSENLKAVSDLVTRYDITQSVTGNVTRFFMIWGILWVFIISAVLYREIYSKRASAFYFSMPVKRETYFNTNMLFGIITMISSFVMLSGVSIAVIRSNVFRDAELVAFDTSAFLLKLLTALFCVLAFLAIFMLCAVISGNTWHYFILSFVSTAVVLSGIMNLANYISSIWGFWVDPSKAWIISPMGTFLFGFREESEWWLIVASIIQFAVFYAIGFVTFKKRKAEVAEMSLAGRILPAVMTIGCLLSVCMAFLSRAGLIVVRVGLAAIATVIVTMILSAIFYRKAFTKTTAKYLAAALISMLVLVCAVEFFPSARYEKYVPSADEVESVIYDENVEFMNKNLSGALIDFLLYASYDSTFDRGLNTYTFTGDEAKEKIEALHNRIVDDETLRNEYMDETYYYGGYSVRITYNLKDGSTVTRSYYVGTKDIYDEYIALMQTDEALINTPPLNLEKEEILFIGVTDYRAGIEAALEEALENYGSYDYYYGPSDYVEVYKALNEYDTLFDLVLSDKKAEQKEVFGDLMNTSAFYYYRYEEHTDYNNISLSVYTYSEDVTDKQREKMSAMTPEEIIMYNNDYTIGYNVFNEYTVHLNDDADVNTISYLQSVGIID